MDQSTRVVTVDINGHRYPIRSHLDAAYVAQLAAFVDEKIRQASRESPAGDSLKTAILAALNIADEVFKLRDDEAVRAARLTDRAEALERMLDLALADDEPPTALAQTAGSF